MGCEIESYIALFAIEKLVAENLTNASNLTLSAIETNRYMDGLLLSSDLLEDLETISRESVLLFQSRGYKLLKWVSNSDSKLVLTGIPKSDLGLNIREIDLGSQPMPDFKALGLVWGVENDKLSVIKRNLLDISTRRQMLSFLVGQFDPMGILAPCLPVGKLILQNVATLGLGWDDELPEDIVKRWRKWVALMESFVDVSIPRYCFAGGCEFACREGAEYQLHGFCDASNYAFSYVVYLRRLVNGRSCVAFVQGKVKVVLTTQTSWVISRKELEAAKMCGALMQAVSKSLLHLGCSLHFWSDSPVVLKWIINPDLHLPRFVKRRVDMIHLVTPGATFIRH